MSVLITCSRQLGKRYWYSIAEQPALAPHLAHPEGCAALHIVLVNPAIVSGKPGIVSAHNLCPAISGGGASQPLPESIHRSCGVQRSRHAGATAGALQVYLTYGFCKVVLQKSIPARISQLILHIRDDKG